MHQWHIVDAHIVCLSEWEGGCGWFGGFPKAPVKILQQGQCRLTDRLPAVLMLHRMLLLLLLFDAATVVVVIVVVSMRTTGQMNNL